MLYINVAFLFYFNNIKISFYFSNTSKLLIIILNICWKNVKKDTCSTKYDLYM